MKKLYIILVSIIFISVSFFILKDASIQKEKISYYISRALSAHTKQETIEFYKKGLVAYPNSLTILTLLSDTYISIGDSDKANALYDSFIIKTNDPQVKSLLVAYKHKMNGDYSSSIKEITNLLESSSEIEFKAFLLSLRGECYLLNKDYKNAINDFTESIKIEPSRNVYEKRSNAYRALGMNDLADKDIVLRDTM